MLHAYRLVKLIETHSEGLAAAYLDKIEKSDRCSAYRNVPAGDLKAVVAEIYRGLGEWLMGKSEAEIEQRYTAIGARRAEENVPLSQVMWAIALVKDNLWEYVQKNQLMDTPIEVFGEMEILQLLEQFFDRAIFYAAVGHERVSQARQMQGCGGRK